MRIKLFIFIVFMAYFSYSCEDKRDDSGKLGGMWQMASWIDSSETCHPTYGLYYIFRKNLVQFQDVKNSSYYYIAYYKRTNDSLFIYHIVNYPNDELCSPIQLQKFGIPDNGMFKIEKLTNDNLILSCDNATITFRKQ